MSNYVCCIARLEGRYIREWVEHYLSLGFDKSIICDNNHEGEDDLDVINDYVEQGKVVIEDYRGLPAYQMKAYTQVYAKYGKEANILYVDVDEFLTLYKHKTIQEFVESFPQDWQAILINWATYGDSGHIYADYSKGVKERFTEPRPNAKSQYNFLDDCHVKSLIRGGLPNLQFFGNPHIPNTPLVCYHAEGYRCNQSPFQDIRRNVACIKHYTTKSLEEYCLGKLQRGTADRDINCFKSTYQGRYFKINDWTREKQAYIDSLGIFNI
jgi:hypothetical protein